MPTALRGHVSGRAECRTAWGTSACKHSCTEAKRPWMFCLALWGTGNQTPTVQCVEAPPQRVWRGARRRPLWVPEHSAFPEGLPEHQGSGRQGWEWEHRGLVSSWGQNLTPTCTPEKHESSPPDSPAPHTWGHHHNLWPSDPFRRISRPPHPLPLAILCSVPRCPSQPGRPWNPGAGF